MPSKKRRISFHGRWSGLERFLPSKKQSLLPQSRNKAVSRKLSTKGNSKFMRNTKFVLMYFPNKIPGRSGESARIPSSVPCGIPIVIHFALPKKTILEAKTGKKTSASRTSCLCFWGNWSVLFSCSFRKKSRIFPKGFRFSKCCYKNPSGVKEMKLKHAELLERMKRPLPRILKVRCQRRSRKRWEDRIILVHLHIREAENESLLHFLQGAIVHVEYTTTPPGERARKAEERSDFAVSPLPKFFASTSFQRASLSFEMFPHRYTEHLPKCDQNIREVFSQNVLPKGEKRIALGTPQRWRFAAKTFIRLPETHSQIDSPALVKAQQFALFCFRRRCDIKHSLSGSNVERQGGSTLLASWI